jgi:hypothetical protein
MQSKLSKLSFKQANAVMVHAAASLTSLCFIVPVALFSALEAVFAPIEFGGFLAYPLTIFLFRGTWLLRQFWYGHFYVEVKIDHRPEHKKHHQLEVRIIMLWFGCIALAWLARQLSPAADAVVATIGAFLMPALLIAQAAIFTQPKFVFFGRPWFVITTIGWRYLWMCPGMLLFALGTNRLFDKRYGDTAQFFVSFGLGIFAGFAALLSFAMMGYFIHTKSEQLGMHPPDLEAKLGEPGPPDSEPSELLAGGRTSQTLAMLAPPHSELSKLLAAGRISEALAALEVAARLAPLNVYEQHRYYAALLRYTSDDAQFANRKLQQAGYLLRAYARAERTEDVARMMEQWWPALRKELLRQTALCLQVATLCVQGGAYERALQLFIAFEGAKSSAPEMPAMMLAHAQLLLTLKRTHEAAKLAQEIVTRFPQADQTHHAQAILQLTAPAI